MPKKLLAPPVCLACLKKDTSGNLRATTVLLKKIEKKDLNLATEAELKKLKSMAQQALTNCRRCVDKCKKSAGPRCVANMKELKKALKINTNAILRINKALNIQGMMSDGARARAETKLKEAAVRRGVTL